jgi:hypothetical protein
MDSTETRLAKVELRGIMETLRLVKYHCSGDGAGSPVRTTWLDRCNFVGPKGTPDFVTVKRFIINVHLSLE